MYAHIRPHSCMQKYEAIRLLFEKLEEQVQKGKIVSYGLSSRSFGLPSSHMEYVSLQRVIEQAETVSAEHSFTTVVFPFNLLEGTRVRQRFCPRPYLRVCVCVCLFLSFCIGGLVSLFMYVCAVYVYCRRCCECA